MRLRDWTIRDGETLTLSTVIYDHEGNALAASDLDSFTLTLVDEIGQSVINEREDQDVLNANGGELDEEGNFTLRLDPADMVIVNALLRREWHDAQLTWVLTTGSPAVEHTGFASIKFRLTNRAWVRPTTTVNGITLSSWRFFRPCGC